jgi:hypothetical protein
VFEHIAEQGDVEAAIAELFDEVISVEVDDDDVLSEPARSRSFRIDVDPYHPTALVL